MAGFSGERAGDPRGSGIRVMPTSLAAQWAALEEHFQRHAKLVARFRETDRNAVLFMWESQTNEGGTSLSEFEREALIERYCELFGTWPACAERAAGVRTHTPVDIELPDRRIAEGKQSIAHKRRRLTEQERFRSDIRLSERVLLNFESTFQLMVGYAGHDRKKSRTATELDGPMSASATDRWRAASGMARRRTRAEHRANSAKS